MDETYPEDSPLKEEQLFDNVDNGEQIGILSENEEIIMVSGQIGNLEEMIAGENPPLQSIENVQKVPETNPMPTINQSSG